MLRTLLLSSAMARPVVALIGAPAGQQPSPHPVIRVVLAGQAAVGSSEAGTVTLRALMGPQAPVTLPVTSTTHVLTFEVPPKSMWETSVAMKGWWAAPCAVSVQEEDVEIGITLVPTGIVVGRLAVPSAEPTPRGLSLKVDVPPGAAKLPGPKAADTPCSVAEDASFSCEVPAGVLDLSLHPAGFVPTYRWGVKVAKGTRTDLGSVTLSKGSSVSGFIALAGAKLVTGKGTVALYVETAATSGTAFRLSRPVAGGTVLANGFFQLMDVPPGRYVLQASYPGFASATASPVQVFVRVEAKIKHTIELQPPVTLTLHIDPPGDSGGHDWRVVVNHASQINNKYEGSPVFDEVAHEGTAVLRGQQGGRYSVVVKDPAGNPFQAEEFVTSGAVNESHTLRIDSVKVAGTVQRGDQPLAATVWFGGRFGDKHVALISNSDGEFRGVLPRSGLWAVVVETSTISTELQADVTKKDGEEEARVELTVPSNRVSGVVVDASDAPYRGATVSYANGPASLRARTDENGAFHFDGVAPGEFTLTAEDHTRAAVKSSAVYTGTVSDSGTLDGITLKLTDGSSLHARVLGPDGPVIGAEVLLRPGRGYDQAPSSTATSGIDGVFDVNVAAGFDRALVLVTAPGYALRVFDIPVDGHAVTLNLPQAGGTLTVTAPKDANGLFFFQDGRWLPAADLFRWMSERGEPLPTSAGFSVGGLAPGLYRGCTLRAGGTKITDMTRCDEGFLAPYGELRLAIP